MLSSRAAAFRVEALLRISTNKETRSGFSESHHRAKGTWVGDLAPAKHQESSYTQAEELKERLACPTNVSDSQDSENATKLRISSKRAGIDNDYDSNIRNFKRPKYEESPKSTTLRCQDSIPKDSESLSSETGLKRSVGENDCPESSPKDDLSAKFYVNEHDCRRTPILELPPIPSSGYLETENTAIPHASKTPSKCLLKTDRLVDSVNTEKNCLILKPRHNVREDLSSSLRYSLKNETNLENRFNERVLRLESSHFQSVTAPTIGLTWPEGIEPRWLPQHDYFHHFRLGHRMVRAGTGTHLPNESAFQSREFNHSLLAPAVEKRIERRQESQRILIQNGVTVTLQHHDLWAQFHQHQTEMIITKNGRRMFPVIKIRVFGLNPDSLYMIYLDMESSDGRRYRYAYPSSTWVVAGTGDSNGQDQAYIHPDSPATGRQWMEMLTISFDKLKLTNNRSRDSKGQVFLYSMQKYRPRLWIQCLGNALSHEPNGKLLYGVNLQKLVDRNLSTPFSFPETSFITVTAYQNQRITRLKINSNPFAKGFRDNSKYKEAMERQLVSPGYGLDCPYGSFRCQGGRQTPYFAPPFPFSPMMPLPPSPHLRPLAPPNRWPPFHPPSDDIFPSISPFLHPVMTHSEANHHEGLDLRFKRCDT